MPLEGVCVVVKFMNLHTRVMLMLVVHNFSRDTDSAREMKLPPQVLIYMEE